VIVVHGATGTTGGMVARRLIARGVPVLLAGRDEARLAALGTELGVPHAIADAADPAALVRAFRGAKVVVACAGPFATIGEPVLRAAISAGAHYVDVAGEQAFLRTTYERHEAAARHAGVCVVPGMAVEVAPGDLAAAWCAAWLSGETEEDDEPVRAYELEAVAHDEPLDEIAVAYLLDRFVPTPATQRSAIAQLGETGVMWRADRWDPVTPGLERRRINAGPELGERDAVSFPAGEVITVPRHVAVRRVQGYLSISRNDWVTRAAGFFAPALPLLGRRIPEKLASWVDAIGPDAHLRAGAQLAIVAQARRGFDEAQVVVAGHDVYATAAAIASWAATALLARREGPCGVLAPAEVFAPRAALRALATEAALTITTSWGERW
jgi:short subunit dehydrogenase-like uncharacterized protein